MASLYRLYGLLVRSDLALHERLVTVDEDADLRVRLELPRAAEADPQGAVVAELVVGDRVLYRVFRREAGGHLLRAHGLCDFEISPDLGEVRCFPHGTANSELVPILVRGTVMALMLDLRGAPSLHASAVEIGGRVFAFLGPSGAGKTTTAAMLCAAGGRLVTDDVLTVELGSDVPRCPAGSTELRLRDAAIGLLDEDGWASARRLLADGRMAVRPHVVEDATVPLDALVFPVPSRSADCPVVHRLGPTSAAFRLAAVPRISGWTCPEARRRAFTHTARLANTVPVYEIAVPWGPPWRPQVALRIVDAIASAAA
jgi:hypothetical protein